MNTIRMSVLILILIELLSGCSQSNQVNIKTEEAKIKELEIQFYLSGKAKDINQLTSIFSLDAVSMHPGKPTIVGKEAIKEWITNVFTDTTYLWDTYTGAIEDIEISPSGDMAFGRGTDRIKVKTYEGIKEIDGKWIDIWKKDNGEWKCSLIMGEICW